VTGFVNPNQVWTNAGAKKGDHLILTKALGTGTLTAALKRREVCEEDIMEALLSMATVNNAIDCMNAELKSGIHAATDITGFGFSGHSMQMANASQVTLKVDAERLPRFGDALRYLESGFLTKAHRTNQEYTESSISVSNLDHLHRLLIHDPQTSGGLLLSVSPELSHEMVQVLRARFESAEIIGIVLPRQEKAVVFE